MNLTMVGRIGPCYLLNYRVPAARVEHLLPSRLKLITHRKFAFLGVVLSRIERMRPRFVPALVGMTYWHIGYRLHVRAELPGGGAVDGLFFLRSDAESRLISLGGNLLTDFRFHPAKISVGDDQITVKSDDGGGDAVVQFADECVDELQSASCFDSIAECARVLTYQPNGLACVGDGVRIAQVIRDESCWRERPIRIAEAKFAFLDAIAPGEFQLERATRVAPIDYVWRLNVSAADLPRSATPYAR